MHGCFSKSSYFCQHNPNSHKYMTHKRSIGELIDIEVRQQGMSIVDFAKLIHCERNNVYDIFKRSNINVELLKRISIVLKRNFFQELADDFTLISEDKWTAEELQQRRAVSQFLDVVPEILHDMGRDAAIIHNGAYKLEHDEQWLPDFGLSDYFITFTIENNLQERVGMNRALTMETITNDEGCQLEVFTNLSYGTVSLNITIEERTEEEWRKTMAFAFETYDRYVKR